MLFTRTGWLLAGVWTLGGTIGAGIVFKPELEQWPVLVAGALAGFIAFIGMIHWRGL